jgi:hypothetical protein
MNELDEALDLLGIAVPVRTYPGCGGLWFGHNTGIADATFDDWGLARAVAVILNAAHREAQARRAAGRGEWQAVQVSRVLARMQA